MELPGGVQAGGSAVFSGLLVFFGFFCLLV